jgi:hypothetical protein
MAQPGHPATLFGACQALLKLLKVTKQSVGGTAYLQERRSTHTVRLNGVVIAFKGSVFLKSDPPAQPPPPSPSELSGNLSDAD